MLSEFDLIQRYFNWPTENVVLGIGDDAAIIAPMKGVELAISADSLVVGRHFFDNADPYKLGFKSLAVNLSDMAAMGAIPKWVTLSLTLPQLIIDQHESWLSEFSKGFRELAQTYRIELIGGDTVSGPLNISIQIIGEVEKGYCLRRDGAQLGDDIWVSGYLGDAALALKHELRNFKLNDNEAFYCKSALHMPIARVELGQRLVGLANSAIDISDGLMADLGHILARSEKAATIELSTIPVSEVMKRYLSTSIAIECILTGGDDYELCFTAPKMNRDAVILLGRELQLPLTIIGEITQQKSQTPNLVVINNNKKVILEKNGYDHFTS